MRKVITVISLLLATIVFAGDLFYYSPLYRSNSGTRPYKDAWGNSYKYYENMWKDTDGDGIINYYDYNDRDPNIWAPYQKKRKRWW